MHVLFCRNFERDYLHLGNHNLGDFKTFEKKVAVKPLGDIDILKNHNPSRDYKNSPYNGCIDDGAVISDYCTYYNNNDDKYNIVIPNTLYCSDICKVFISSWSPYESHTAGAYFQNNSLMSDAGYANSTSYINRSINLVEYEKLKAFLASLGPDYKAYLGYNFHFNFRNSLSSYINVYNDPARNESRALIHELTIRANNKYSLNQEYKVHHCVEIRQDNKVKYYSDGALAVSDKSVGSYAGRSMLNSRNPTRDFVSVGYISFPNISSSFMGFSDVYLIAAKSFPGILKVKAVDTILVGHSGLVNKAPDVLTEENLGFNPHDLNNQRTAFLGDISQVTTPSGTNEYKNQPGNYQDLHYALPQNKEMSIYLDTNNESYQSLNGKQILGMYSHLEVATKHQNYTTGGVDTTKDKMVFTVKPTKVNSDYNDIDSTNEANYVLSSLSHELAKYNTYYTKENDFNYNGLSGVILNRQTGDSFYNVANYKLATVKGGYNTNFPSLTGETSKHMRRPSWLLKYD